MAGEQIGRVIGQIRRAAAREAVGELADGELLTRYADRGEEAAFEALLQRHGPLVLGVCRRILGDAHAAEDAFQATFLILSRKARGIRRSASLASWLHGVARRVAVRARESVRVRRRYEWRWRRTPPADALQEVAWRDVGAILDEEIRRLPDRVRAPFVLCYLEGATNDSAARALGCPTGTVLSRLSRARDLLRTRLARRGLTLTAAYLAVAPAEARCAVPMALAEAACRTAGNPKAVAPAVAALAVGVLRPAALKLVVAVASGMAVAFAAWAVGPAGRSDADSGAAEALPVSVRQQPLGDLVQLRGRWQMVERIANGIKNPPETCRVCTATVDGNVMTLFGPFGLSQKMIIELGPTANPKTFDATPADGPAKGLTNHGIYRLDGDTLQLCLWAVTGRTTVSDGPGMPEQTVSSSTARPDSLAAPFGSFRALMTLERIRATP